MTPRDLSKACDQFWKFAEISVSKVSIVENDEPILKKISDLKSFDDRIALAEKHFEKLGEGSSRTVFKLSNELVLKVAHNDKGIAQNFAEMEPKMQRPCTNHILTADAKGRWVIVRFTENLTIEKFKELMGFSFKSFTTALFYKFNNESDDWEPPKDYDEIIKSEFFKCIAELVLDCDLQLGDVDKIGSWGLLKNKILLRDTGLTRGVWTENYKNSKST